MKTAKPAIELPLAVRLNSTREPQVSDRPPGGKTRVMGILNTTPDSFSDGGLWTDRDSALRHAIRMAENGADIIDVGGESTRPGAQAVPLQEELDRVIPVIESVVRETGLPVSVDTGKPLIMEAAVRAGASMINDVYALRLDGALDMAARLNVPVCIMHMQGQPRTMQHEPDYTDVAGEVESFLMARAAACEAAGVPGQNIFIDPGFGFGKTYQHNVKLFQGLSRLCASRFPVLVGISRKAMLGAMTSRPVTRRMAASIASAVLAAQAGAAIVRVHDVDETVDALRVMYALTSEPIETEPPPCG